MQLWGSPRDRHRSADTPPHWYKGLSLRPAAAAMMGHMSSTDITRSILGQLRKRASGSQQEGKGTNRPWRSMEASSLRRTEVVRAAAGDGALPFGAEGDDRHNTDATLYAWQGCATSPRPPQLQEIERTSLDHCEGCGDEELYPLANIRIHSEPGFKRVKRQKSQVRNPELYYCIKCRQTRGQYHVSSSCNS